MSTQKLSSLKLYLFAIAFLTLFTFCDNSNLSGKWYIKNMENLVTKEKRDEKNCYFFDFLDGEHLNSVTSSGELGGDWQQSEDTLIIQLDRDTVDHYFKLELSKPDTMVLVTLQDGKPAVRFSFNRKCAAFKD